MGNNKFMLYLMVSIIVAVALEWWIIVFLELTPVAVFLVLMIVTGCLAFYIVNRTEKKIAFDDGTGDESSSEFDEFIKDELTQIYNQEKFRGIINLEMQRMRILKTTSSSVIFDIDNFEEINSRLGRDDGDKILIHLVQIIKSLIRDSDIFARVVGDSFMILLPNTTIENAYTLAERIRITVEESEFVKKEPITCSFGVVALTSSMNEDTLIDLSKEKLKIAKQMGKNTVV